MAELTVATLVGSGTTLMVLTSLVAGTRLVSGLRHTGLRGVRWDDGWLFAGYVLFMALGAGYAAHGPALVRLLLVQRLGGPRRAHYRGSDAETAAVRRLFLFTVPGLWLSLWCVKFSLLALYRKVMLQSPAYARAWWAVNLYCILTLLALLLSHIVMILGFPVDHWWIPGSCLSGNTHTQDVRITILVWYGVDITSDLAVMILPIYLIGSLVMPRHIKLSLGFLFGLGMLVIIAATAYVIQAGTNEDPCPALAWVALWSTIESSVAIIVGCGPGLYRQGNGPAPLRPADYYLTQGGTTVTANSTWAGKYSSKGSRGSRGSRTQHSQLHHDIPLSPYAYPVATTVQARRECSSEGHLVGVRGRHGITITKSVKMESEVELSRPDEALLVGRAVSS